MSATADSGIPQDDDVLTVEQAAKFLRLGRNAVYDAIGRGEIPHRRIGRAMRLSRAALVRWLGSWSSQDAKEGQQCLYDVIRERADGSFEPS